MAQFGDILKGDPSLIGKIYQSAKKLDENNPGQDEADAFITSMVNQHINPSVPAKVARNMGAAKMLENQGVGPDHPSQGGGLAHITEREKALLQERKESLSGSGARPQPLNPREQMFVQLFNSGAQSNPSTTLPQADWTGHGAGDDGPKMRDDFIRQMVRNGRSRNPMTGIDSYWWGGFSDDPGFDDSNDGGVQAGEEFDVSEPGANVEVDEPAYSPDEFDPGAYTYTGPVTTTDAMGRPGLYYESGQGLTPAAAAMYAALPGGALMALMDTIPGGLTPAGGYTYDDPMGWAGDDEGAFAPQMQPAAISPYSPFTADMPSWMNLPGTDFQQLSKVATEALYGDPRYRTEPGTEIFRSLVDKVYRDPQSGEALPGVPLTPVVRQYVQDVLGKPRPETIDQLIRTFA
jgi:hypothetical protein